MRNAIRRWYLGLVPVVGLLIWATLPVEGQVGARNGEWTTYGGDLANTRYAPLDQINAGNFDKLEVAWRFKTDSLGPRPEYKLEGTPIMVKGVLYTTGGTRRSVIALDAKTGELIWSHSLREGKRAAVSPRQLSGRGVSFWTDGRGDDRVIYVTTGYRLVELNAKTGVPVQSFGTNGVVDLKVGAYTGLGQQIDLVNGEIGLHATPTVVKDVVLVGSSFKGMLVGLLSGWFARKVQSTGWGIVVGSSLGLLFAFLVAVMDASKGKPHYLEIMLPGFIVGAIVGFLTQKMGTPAMAKS